MPCGAGGHIGSKFCGLFRYSKAPQQLSWAYGSALPPSGLLGWMLLIKGLQTRRAVLFALPEFVRYQFEQLRKTISDACQKMNGGLGSIRIGLSQS